MTTLKASAQQLVHRLQHARRQRQAARASRRALEQELSSYRSPGEVNDLLGLISHQEGAEAEEIREILLNNLATRAA
jgi:hypothetical protein